MDQVKIGKFIAERRKNVNLTQAQLAEKLNITDRAVSKWETGKSMPDSSIMLELCDVLEITVNDLLCGEVVRVDNYSKELENKLMETIREKEQADKRMLRLEVFIGVTATLTLFIFIALAAFLPLQNALRVLLVVLGFVIFLVGCFYALRIEQTAGYYVCRHCGHRYVPTYKAVALARHMGRKRYMRCPNCGQKAWQKKSISKES